LIFDLQPYKKIDLVENWFCVKIPVFLLFFWGVFLTLLKTIGNFLLLTPQSTNYIHLTIRNRVHFLRSEHFYCSKTW
ncbi:Uncharacterized protein FWK35_00003819, partial [Aphis craccivora]